MANAQKTGRKQKHFTNPKTGLPVVGLSQMTDGRWRIIGTQTRFTEPDWEKAVERFYKLTADPAQELEDRQRRNRAHNRIGIDWAEVAKVILAKPHWVAQQTGIEWIAYGPDLRTYPDNPRTS